MNKYKLIYNPAAGKKKRFTTLQPSIRIEDIRILLDKYRINADLFVTSKAGDAKNFAADSEKEGYTTVIAVGGDGTVSEVANGLVKTKVKLGIIPAGTFMNIARMLSIPEDLEKAIMLIKLSQTKKLDMGIIKEISGKEVKNPYYFFETAGIGLEAEIQKITKRFENRNLRSLLDIFRMPFVFYVYPVYLTLDNNRKIRVKATVVMVSNGPYSGAAFQVAPEAKLNDHLLTVKLYRMTKSEIIQYFVFRNIFKESEDKISTYQAHTVRIETKRKRTVHADATIYGKTPVEFSILPNAIEVICGYSLPAEESTLKDAVSKES